MWVLVEILLMIIFGIVPRSCRNNLGNNLLFVMLLLNLCRDPIGDLLLFWRMIKDGRSILCATVRTLVVAGRRIVHAVKELNETCVVYPVVGGIFDLQGFCVLCDP